MWRKIQEQTLPTFQRLQQAYHAAKKKQGRKIAVPIGQTLAFFLYARVILRCCALPFRQKTRQVATHPLCGVRSIKYQTFLFLHCQKKRKVYKRKKASVCVVRAFTIKTSLQIWWVFFHSELAFLSRLCYYIAIYNSKGQNHVSILFHFIHSKARLVSRLAGARCSSFGRACAVCHPGVNAQVSFKLVL